MSAMLMNTEMPLCLGLWRKGSNRILNSVEDRQGMLEYAKVQEAIRHLRGPIWLGYSWGQGAATAR